MSFHFQPCSGRWLCFCIYKQIQYYSIRVRLFSRENRAYVGGRTNSYKVCNSRLTYSETDRQTYITFLSATVLPSSLSRQSLPPTTLTWHSEVLSGRSEESKVCISNILINTPMSCRSAQIDIANKRNEIKWHGDG